MMGGKVSHLFNLEQAFMQNFRSFQGVTAYAWLIWKKQGSLGMLGCFVNLDECDIQLDLYSIEHKYPVNNSVVHEMASFAQER